MAIDITGFILGKVIAEREGVSSDKATKFALLQGLMGSSPLSLLIIRELAKSEVESEVESAEEEQLTINIAQPASSGVSIPTTTNSDKPGKTCSAEVAPTGSTKPVKTSHAEVAPTSSTKPAKTGSANIGSIDKTPPETDKKETKSEKDHEESDSRKKPQKKRITLLVNPQTGNKYCGPSTSATYFWKTG